MTKETKEMTPRKPDQGGMTKPGKADQTTTPKDSMHDKGDAAFKEADKDNDGTLDRNEAKAMPNVAKNFDAIDTDKDGTVSLAEINTYMKAQLDADKNQAAVKN
jgi:Ca2+-binding EF-hand superfamily protein